jgi:hypothetical protein
MNAFIYFRTLSFLSFCFMKYSQPLFLVAIAFELKALTFLGKHLPT